MLRLGVFRASLLMVVGAVALQPTGASAQMALPGSFSVSEGGAASYEIPIDVPPGTAGMEPKLALTYSSSGGNGLLGVGWALSGLSQVSRCARTVSIDGQHGGINYDANDRFCINGDRLVAINGVYGADGTEYRTQSEGFSRIVSHGVAGLGPASFSVWTKAGLKMEFGATADSRIEAQGKATVRLWSLNRVADTVGNYMTVSYIEDTANGSYRPDRIDYTGNTAQALTPFASVRFVYEARPRALRHYVAGSPVHQTKRLLRIESYNSSALVSEFRLSYLSGSVLNPSLVSEVTKCSGNGLCLPSVQLGVTPSPALTFGQHANLNGNNSYYINWSASIVDINGDGRSDLFWDYKTADGRSAGYRHIWLSNGDGTFATVGNVAGADTHYINWAPSFADFNGDGISDILWDYKDAHGRSAGYRNIWIGVGDGTFSVIANAASANGSYINWTPSIADFNGDGLSDVFWDNKDVYGRSVGHRILWIGRGDGTFNAHVNVANANGYFINWAPSFADFNGDGMSDVLWDYKSTDGRSAGYRSIWLSNGDGTFSTVANVAGVDTFYINWSPAFGDFNGDGQSDILWDYKDIYGQSAGYRNLWLSKGDGTFEVIGNAAGVDGYYINWTPSIVDLNGDGLSDIFWDWTDNSGRSRGQRNVWLSRGDGTFDVTANLAGHNGYYINWRPAFGDFDGNGLADVFWDFVYPDGRSQGSRDLLLSADLPPHRLASVSNGLGSTSHIEYASLSEAGGPYEKDSGVNAASYPQMDLQAPMYVVSELRADDGVGGVTTTRYRYGGLKYDHERRQALGFRWREVEQVETGVKKYTEYRQDFPYVGRASLTQTRVPNVAQGNGGLVRQSESQYICEDFAGAAGCQVQVGARYFVSQSQSVEKGWDLDGTALPQTTTTSVYDNYGNATSVNVSVFDPATSQTFTKTTTNTYDNPAYNATNDTWILGRLTRAEVTSTTP